MNGANMFYSLITDTGILKLIDFGTARFFDIYRNKGTHLLGMQGYVAPEQYGFPQTEFSTNTEGEQWVTGNRLINVEVKPNPKES